MTTRRSTTRHRCPWLACWLGCVGLLAACSSDPPTEADPHASSGTTASEITTTTTTSTTTSSSTTALDGTTDATEDGLVFLIEPDGGGEDFECSPLEQDCPRGHKCMPWSNDGGSAWNATRCVPLADDPSGVGEPCTVVGSGVSGEDDCDGTSMCWDVDPKTLEGTCVAFCLGPKERLSCADPCDRCVFNSDGTITLCLAGCDPFAQTCPRGQGCYPIGDELACAPDASPAGAGIGSPCDSVNACPAGMVCMGPDSVPGCPDGAEGCCTPFCPAGGVDPCDWVLPGSSCMPLFEAGEGPPVECYGALVGACMQVAAVIEAQLATGPVETTVSATTASATAHGVPERAARPVHGAVASREGLR